MMPCRFNMGDVIPENLAYGERGAGRDIAPYSTLIFTLDLKGIEAPAEKEKKEWRLLSWYLLRKPLHRSQRRL